MTEPILILQQRETLATFRKGINGRASIEPQIGSRHTSAVQQAESTLGQTVGSLQKQLSAAINCSQRAEEVLDAARLKEIWSSVQSARPSGAGGGSPSRELSTAVDTSGKALDVISRTADALDAQRRARSTRRTTLAVVAVFVVLAIAVAAIMGYRAMRVESLYRAASAALAAGSWEETRTHLAALEVARPAYNDSATLLRESYYRPALTALEAGRWEDARAQLEPLLQIDGAYKDAGTLLLESYYRPAKAAFDAGHWEQARTILGPLVKLDGGYRNVQALLRESYYIPAQRAFDAGDWEETRTQLTPLLQLDREYKEAPTLLRESYYRPAKQALGASRWSEAQAELKALISVDATYRDSEDLLQTSYLGQVSESVEMGQWTVAAKAIVNVRSADAAKGLFREEILMHPELLRELANQYDDMWKRGAAAIKCELDLEGGNGHFGFAYSPDGRYLAVIYDNSIKVVDTLNCVRTAHFGLGEKTGVGEELTFTSGSTVALGGSVELGYADYEDRVLLFDIESEHQVGSFTVNKKKANWFSIQKVFSLPGDELLIWAAIGDIGSGENMVVDARTDERVTQLQPKGLGVLDVDVSTDGKLVAAGREDGQVHVWNHPGSLRSVYVGTSSEVMGVDFSPDGSLLAVESQDGSVHIWDLASGQEKRTLKGPYGSSDRNGVTFSSGGEVLASTHGDSSAGVVLWNVVDGTKVQSLSTTGNHDMIAFAPDGRALAVLSYSGELALWEPR